jgi:RNA polymerase sigma-70 factor (ECF subfamily)
VARFYLGLMKKVAPSRVVFRMLNGLPAVLIEVDDAPARYAPRLVVRCDVDADGRIQRVHTILARAKLSAVDAVAS